MLGIPNFSNLSLNDCHFIIILDNTAAEVCTREKVLQSCGHFVEQSSLLVIELDEDAPNLVEYLAMKVN